MRVAIVEPKAHLISFVDVETINEAQRLAGLKAVDHGVAADGVGIIAGEYSMYVDPDQQDYFTFGGPLYAGNAVLYAYDKTGATIDVSPEIKIAPLWLHGRKEVEAAIAQGLVARPELTVNKRPVWRWPDPSPFDASAA